MIINRITRGLRLNHSALKAKIYDMPHSIREMTNSNQVI
jgi:hypothetical protein